MFHMQNFLSTANITPMVLQSLTDPGGKSGHSPLSPIQFGCRLFPLQRRNKCEILGIY